MDHARRLEPMRRKPASHRFAWIDNHIGWADDAVFLGTTECALPHPHHIVGDVAFADPEMLFRSKIRLHFSVKIAPIQEAVMYRHR